MGAPDWSKPPSNPPSDLRLDHFLEHRAALSPFSVAYEDGVRVLTYRELDQLANGVAHTLAKAGCGPETVVGVFTLRSLEYPVATMGVLKAGAAVFYLDPAEPQARLLAICRRLSLRHVVTTPSLADEAAAFAEVTLVDLASATAAPRPPETTADGATLAQILPTSGSTGEPKLVMRTHGMLVGQMLYEQKAFALRNDDRHLFKFPVSFRESLLAALAGGVVVVAEPGAQSDSRRLAELIRTERLTVASFVPTALNDLLRASTRADLASLRHLSCGGELFTNELRRRFHAKCEAQLHSTFTMTEADYVSTWDSHPGEPRPNGWLGRPTNMRLHVVDDEMRPVGPGDVGEILIGGPALARGYFGDLEATRSKFIPDPFGPPGAIVYRAGDLARMLPDGTLAYAGRADDQVKLGGQRIDLGEVDSALLGLDGVEDAATAVWTPLEGAPRLVAHLVRGASAPSPSEIRSELAQRLPSHMVPSHFVPADRLPRLANGKLDRRSLPPPERSRGPATQPFAPPESATERAVAAVWADVLWLDSIGVDDNFFDAGGTSLLAMEAQARLAVLGLAVGAADVIARGSVRRLAAFIDTGESEPSAGRVATHSPAASRRVAALRARRTRDLTHG